MKRHCLLFLLLASLNVLFISPYSPARFLRWNVSQSLEHKLFIALPLHGELEKGQVVSVSKSDIPISLAKRIVGVPGDGVLCCGQSLRIGAIGHEVTMTKAPDSCLQLLPSQVIPEGHYFVAGEHPSSFDSRYEGFGLVKSSEIREVLWPVF